MGSLTILGLSKLKNVMLVEGLTVNLISQLCDENMFVRFTKDRCILHGQNQCNIMEGNRSSNNCYLLTSTSIFMNMMLNNQST